MRVWISKFQRQFVFQWAAPQRIFRFCNEFIKVLLYLTSFFQNDIWSTWLFSCVNQLTLKLWIGIYHDHNGYSPHFNSVRYQPCFGTGIVLSPELYTEWTLDSLSFPVSFLLCYVYDYMLFSIYLNYLYRDIDFLDCLDPIDLKGNKTLRDEIGHGCLKVSPIIC